MDNYYDILLINEKLLKSYSPISDNVDVTDIVPFISIAQEIHIKPIIGEILENDLKKNIKANTLSSDYSALIVKIAPALAYWTIYEALPFHYMKIVNKGVTTLQSENSSSPSYKDISQLRANVQNTAERLELELIKFLCECNDKYTLWNPDNSSCCDSIITKNENGKVGKSFDSGIYMKKKSDTCNNNGCGCNNNMIIID